MVKIDLITGFLGSGKTTFIKKYAKYLMDQGEQIGILENDYGAVNVDMMLLQDLEGDNCELEMVSGGCDADCHRRRFKTKLIAMGMCGYDRVLIEPSGIFDVDEFFDVLYEEPLNQWYEIGNVIAIVDARLEEDLSPQSEYLLASEIANGGKIVLSRVQEASEEEIQRTIAHLNRALEGAQCQRRVGKEVLCVDWEKMTEEDLLEISRCGFVSENYVKSLGGEENGYSSLYYMNISMPVQELCTRIEKLMENPCCGRIFRVKGFMRTEDGDWTEINATHNGICVTPIKKGQEILIVIGERLNGEAVERELITAS